MTTAEQIQNRYRRLDSESRHIVQIYSIKSFDIGNHRIMDASKALDWRDSSGKLLKVGRLKTLIADLRKKELLLYGTYNEFCINPEVQDLAIQDAVRQQTFSTICETIEEDRCFYRDTAQRDIRIAFYGGDVATYRKLHHSGSADNTVRVLDPFCREIFDQLDPVLQEMYLVDSVPRMIETPSGDKSFLVAFDQAAKRLTDPGPSFLAARLDLAVARGDVDLIHQLDEQTGRKHKEIAGCYWFLKGDFEAAESLFAAVMSGGRKKGKLGAIQHLPAILYLFCLFKKNTAESMVEACSIIASVGRSRTGGYKDTAEVFEIAIQFRQSLLTPRSFLKLLDKRFESSLEILMAGYFATWLLDGNNGSIKWNRLLDCANRYATGGLDWLALEASVLAANSNPKSNTAKRQQYQASHTKLGTCSLVDFVKTEPVWLRSLHAIAELATVGATATATATTATERMIWELKRFGDSILLDAFRQKRSKKGWSKGQKVSRERLSQEHLEPKFAFMTDLDHSLCQAIVSSVEQDHYGYRETVYRYDETRAARALIGHPCVFNPGDRENPIEIVEKSPQMIVTKGKNGQISLSLDPKPLDETEKFRMVEDGPGRIAVITFNDRHLKLHKILGGKLTVPASAASDVVRAIQPVADLISVHSAIDLPDSNLPADESITQAQKVKSDSRPHVHLLPFQDGLRVEFYVRPFGDAGPFCKPAQGGTTVFAKIGDHSQTAKRNFAVERKLQGNVFKACPVIDSMAAGDAPICLPSPVEALETLVELEKLVEQKQIILHWPKGRSFDLAGRASTSQFHLHIRKDRDWFAASGTLKIDKGLELDMMELIDMVEASPSRFVEMSDGRFLALTEKLRLRIKELSAYGDRRSTQNKLRFPKAHAVVLDDLGETCKLKSDPHWKKWVKRMRDSGDLVAEVPSTLQTELRDYQEEGFQWLARLAAWGMGGCLADDMGLGKTIEALTLLLHRASGGPALVIAPTSVALNWVSETHKFAPTLNVRIFGEGDRAKSLGQLGPHDIVICSYGLLHTEAKNLQSQAWHTVILDEAQAIKNMATQRSKAAMGLQADFRLIMTGTPLENHLGELWNLMEFINPGMLGSHDRFQKRFAIPIERDGCRESRQRLKKLIQPFILRRTKSQVLDELPPRTEVTLQVKLSDEEAAFYEAIRKRAIENLEKPDKPGGQHLKILAELMRLRRACCHPSLVLENCEIAGSKLKLFSDTIDELIANQHKVLVFSQFVDHLTILRERLDDKGIAYQYLDGSTPPRKRKKAVDAFQAGEGDVFLISLKAGGTGLNLTAADYVIHMDPWWNPAVEDQASDRAHRIGQQRPVTVYRLITEGTIEERITELHAKKRNLADSLLEGTDISSKLTAEQLLSMLRD